MRRFTSNLNQKYTSMIEHRFNDGTPTERIDIDSVFAEVFGLPDSPHLYLSTLPAEGLKVIFEFESDREQSGFETAFKRLGLRSFQTTFDHHKATVIWQPQPIGGVSVIAALYQNDLGEFGDFLSSVMTAFENTLTQKRELILVDDFSPNIVEIRKKLKTFAPRFVDLGIDFKLIEKESNEGPGITRNLGARNANFSNLLFLDSDDLIHPLYFQVFGQELEMGSNFISCNMALPDQRIFCALPSTFSETLFANGNGSCIGLNKQQVWISRASSGNALYTQERLSHYEDWELNLVLKGLGISLSILPIPLYYYRRKDSGRDSSKSNLQANARFRCIESAWSRLNSQTALQNSHAGSLNFLPAYQQLLHDFSFPFDSRSLNLGQHRKKMLKLIFRAIQKLIWQNELPRWLQKMKLRFTSRKTR